MSEEGYEPFIDDPIVPHDEMWEAAREADFKLLCVEVTHGGHDGRCERCDANLTEENTHAPSESIDEWLCSACVEQVEEGVGLDCFPDEPEDFDDSEFLAEPEEEDL